MKRPRLQLRQGKYYPLKNRLHSRFSNSRFSQGNLKNLSLSAMVPNIVTISALCCGVTAIKMSILGHWNWAIIAILIAGFLDAMDGRLARLLKSDSRFGAELDSFSDLLSFGAAPALVIYLKSLKSYGDWGWGLCLFFIVCMALRLARFNTRSIEGGAPNWAQNFFTGVPAPAAAYLALLPLMVQEYHPLASLDIPLIYGLFLGASGGLMVSRIPTFSLKKATIPHRLVLPLMLIVFLVLVAIYSQPWLTLIIIGVLYLALIPYSLICYNRARKNFGKAVVNATNAEHQLDQI